MANNENTFNMEVYPNPSTKIITLKAKFNKSLKNTVYIYNMNGKELKKQELKRLNGEKEVKIDIANLSSGNYIIMLRNKEFASKKKFYIF